MIKSYLKTIFTSLALFLSLTLPIPVIANNKTATYASTGYQLNHILEGTRLEVDSLYIDYNDHLPSNFNNLNLNDFNKLLNHHVDFKSNL